jgi:hypothetical protein
MFREPVGVVACLNHYLQSGVTFVSYDQRSWIWSVAADFAEGEIVSEKFCVVFENGRDAIAFRTTLENVVSERYAVPGKSVGYRQSFNLVIVFLGYRPTQKIRARKVLRPQVSTNKLLFYSTSTNI